MIDIAQRSPISLTLPYSSFTFRFRLAISSSIRFTRCTSYTTVAPGVYYRHRHRHSVKKVPTNYPGDRGSQQCPFEHYTHYCHQVPSINLQTTTYITATMKSSIQAILATALLTATVTAQDQYRINPDSVPDSLRNFWCDQQIAQCPLICSQTVASQSLETNSNDCTASDLTYSCVCENGFSPNVSEYSQTLPFFICQQWGTQCVANCGNGNTACQSSCTADHPCGAQNPTRQNTSTLTGTMTKSASAGDATGATTLSDGGQVVTTDGQTATLYGLEPTATPSNTGSGGDDNADTSDAVSHVRVWALSAGQTFGSIALFGSMVGGFALLS